MSTDSWSWIFSVPIDDVRGLPSIDGDRDLAQLFEKYDEKDYLESNYPGAGYAAQLYVTRLAEELHLPCLLYVNASSLILKPEALPEIVRAFDVLLEVWKRSPERMAYEGWHIRVEEVIDAGRLEGEEFWRKLRGDHNRPTAYKIFDYFKSNRQWLHHIAQTGNYAFYVQVQHR